jgi:hypothetical protein
MTKSKQNKHVKQEKLFIDELWIALAAFLRRKRTQRLKNRGRLL